MTSQNIDRNGDVARLSPEQQRALLAELLRKRAAGAMTASQEFPMSAGQQGLWYAYCRDPHATPFNVFLPSRIRSNLDLNALQKTIEFLANRHACLRTTFTDTGGELKQVVHASLPPEFKVFDATALSADSADLQTMVSAESQRAFNLQQGPLLRLAVFQLAADDYVVLATTHHIVVDFWSLILMLAELRQVYPSLVVGRAPNLPPASNNYQEFVADQQAMLQSAACERLRGYWRDQLQDAPTVLDLVTDYERPQAFTGRAAIQSLELSTEVSNRIFQLATTARTTAFAILHAALQVLLCQSTNQREFLIGSPFSGRSHHKFESTVGFFVNMLPLRADLRGDPTFLQLIERTNAALLGALEFEAYPFSAIVRDFNPPRDASRSPLFQVSCTFEKAQLRSESGRAGFLFPGEREVASLEGLQQESFYVPQQTCHYDLEFIFEQNERGLRGMICYCRDLFSADSMQVMADNFERILHALLLDPNRNVLDCASHPQVMKATTADHSDSNSGSTVCEMIEKAVQRNETNPAIRAGADSWTYAEMKSIVDAHAKLLRDDLSSLKMTAQPILPAIGPSSPHTLMVMLGVMFSGAAVVPIDSAQPAIAHDDLIADTEPAIVLEAPFDHPPNADSMPPRCSPSDLAYVIYTSGSTGRPKGVMIEHRSICNTLKWRHSTIPVGAGDRVLFLLSLQFDAGLGIALAALTQGAELVWADVDVRNDIHALVEQLIRDRITVLPAIPSFLRLIVEHPRFSECKDLRMLWTGGEAMPRELPQLVKQRSQAKLWNLYGPTEAAVEAIAACIETHDERCTVPLGKPISGTEVLVVDDALRIQPDTVAGQLAIAGVGLARGYLKRPDLTADRFVQIKVGGESVRAYLTGDRGRRLKNGQFEFLGRTDFQVKIRGYRIELEEIEQHLIAHPLVTQAAVIVLDAGSAAAQLVGYVETREPAVDREAAAVQIRRDVSARLPAYKVPVQLFVLDALPMTSSGKVDRKRLPKVTVPTVAHIQVPAATPLEVYLASEWCEALKLPSVSVDQNFFELGGSSLQAAILTAKLTASLGVHVPTSLLFDLADISQIAQRLVQLYEVQIAERFGMSSVTAYASRGDQAAATTSSSDRSSKLHPLLAPLKATGDRRAVFMVHPPGGIVMCYRELAARVDPHQPLIAIRSRGLHGHEPLPQSIEEAARDYVAAMRSLQPTGPYRLGGWSLGGLFALEMATQLLESGEAVEQLLLLDTAIPDGASQLVPSDELVSAGSEYGLNLSLSELNALHPDEQLPLLWEHAKSLGVLREETPPEVVTQVLQDLKSLFHHHMELATRYQVRSYPGVITLVRPTEVPFEQHVAPDRGWRHVAQRVDVRYVSGHHHSMVQMPHVIELASAIELPQ